MPRFRFTVRRMMAAVAIVAMGLGVLIMIKARSRSFESRAQWHARQSTLFIGTKSKMEHHMDLWFKYERAARSPWLPVPADPPEPR